MVLLFYYQSPLPSEFLIVESPYFWGWILSRWLKNSSPPWCQLLLEHFLYSLPTQFWKGGLHSDFFMSCSGCGALWLCFYSFLIITQLGQELISLSVHPLRCGGSGECLSLLLNRSEQDSLNIRSQLCSKKSMLPNLPSIMFYFLLCVLAKVK